MAQPPSLGLSLASSLALLLATMAGPIAAATPPPPGKTASESAEAQVVRALRLAYNQALAERRTGDLTGFMVPSAVLMGSSGKLTVGAEKIRDGYAGTEFLDREFIAYDRQPDSIEISANGRFALERGHWRGRYHDGKDGETGNTGLYQAGWLKQDGTWRLRSEHYLRLTCASESDCP